MLAGVGAGDAFASHESLDTIRLPLSVLTSRTLPGLLFWSKVSVVQFYGNYFTQAYQSFIGLQPNAGHNLCRSADI